MTRLAYLGPPGTYSEEAALRYDRAVQLAACATESEVAAAVETGSAEEGVLAIENSLEGSVARSLDALIHESSARIKREIVLNIEHCLVAASGTSLAAIREVHAHPQALAQCRKFIDARLPGVSQLGALSNAAAVQEIVKRSDAAAIASARAAELYGATVVAAGIQDNPHNKTRFVVIAHQDEEPTGSDKTSIAFTVAHDQPGTLVGVLHEFSDRSINLTRIESRPSREELGIYIFLVDMEGHRTDASVAAALDSVKSQAQFFRVLGSYPRSPDAGDP
jgi:prephenate dehydratase